MATISAAMVKQLREKTGAGMMDCKEALTECSGDIDKAVDFLRKKGLATAQKRAGRAMKEGVVGSYIHTNNKIGVMVEVNCETDFVAKTDDFKEFAGNIAMHIAETASSDVAPEDISQAEALLDQPYANEPGKSIKDYLNEVIAKTGENITIRRFACFHFQIGVGSYIHTNNKIGVVAEMNCESDSVATTDDFKEFARNIAMHIAAAAPLGVVPEDIPQEIIDKEKEIYKAQAQATGKPENILDKIAEGKLGKFYKENCLLDQPYVKDPSKSIKDYLNEVIAKTGEKITIRRFARFQVGE